MVEKISSAYSDDGQRQRIRRSDDFQEQLRPIHEHDGGVNSITAELSDHRHRLERPDEDDAVYAIYEQPNESENASSLPGSINDRHDIRSENITTNNFKKFGTSHNKPFTVKAQDAVSDEIVSKEALKSEVTKVSSAVAVVSPPLPVPETSRSIQNYSHCYDRLYAEFKEELVQEYAMMRGCYMGEYQENYDQNTSRKEDKIAEMNQNILFQCNYIKELYAYKGKKTGQMSSFYQGSADQYLKRFCFSVFKNYYEERRRNRRQERQVLKTYREVLLKKAFYTLRNETHQRFVQKLGAKETQFRMELESKILVQYRNKVDSLLLYAAELEDKIKLEQDAREKMTRLYDQSLHQGFQVFNEETQCLAQGQMPVEQLIRHN